MIQTIMEEILSHSLLLETIFIGIIILFYLCSLLLKKFKIIKSNSCLSSIILIIISLVIIIIGYSNTNTEVIMDNEWKTIYPNNQNTNITLKNYDTYRYIDLSLPYSIDVSKELLEKYKVFANDEDWYGYVMAEKDGDTVTHHVILRANNIISTSKITEKSKISKIEYRKSYGYYKTFGPYKGRMIPYGTDEIRVTIGENHQETLNKLFDN